MSLIQCYPHRKLQRNRNHFPSRLINGEIIWHSNFCIWDKILNGVAIQILGFSETKFGIYIFSYFGSYQHNLRTQTREATTRNTSAFAGSIISSERIYLGRFPFVRTGRPDHCPTSQFENEMAFSKSFCWKTISFGEYYSGFDWSGWRVLIKREIIIATRMVWSVSSDKWKAP